MNIGQRHELVSRLTIAMVDMHCMASTKNTIIDNATFENPSQLATGVSFVLVNGVPVVDGGQVTASLPGRALRGPASE